MRAEIDRSEGDVNVGGRRAEWQVAHIDEVDLWWALERVSAAPDCGSRA